MRHDQTDAADEADDDDYDGYESELDIDPDDLPPVHIEDIRYAKHEQRRQAESGDYGPEPFAMVEGDEDRTCVKPQLIPPTLSELVLLAKIKRAEHAATSSRMSVARLETADRVHDFFTRWTTRTHGSKTEPEPSVQPPAPRSTWGEWLKERFSTPKRPVWK